MKALLLLLVVCLSKGIFAQRVVDVTDGNNTVNPSSFFSVAGTPFLNEKYVKLVKGSPYFADDYWQAVLVSTTGQEYKNVTVKLNLHSGEVLYKDESGAELIAKNVFKEIILTDPAGNNYKFAHSSGLQQDPASPLEEGWYLWLYTGKASLYKYFKKTLTESTPYGASATEQTIATKEKYLLSYNNTFMEIKKLKDAPSVLANKKTELENFLKTRDQSHLSSDDRVLALIAYYDSLFPAEK